MIRTLGFSDDLVFVAFRSEVRLHPLLEAYRSRAAVLPRLPSSQLFLATLEAPVYGGIAPSTLAQHHATSFPASCRRPRGFRFGLRRVPNRSPCTKLSSAGTVEGPWSSLRLTVLQRRGAPAASRFMMAAAKIKSLRPLAKGNYNRRWRGVPPWPPSSGCLLPSSVFR